MCFPLELKKNKQALMNTCKRVPAADEGLVEIYTNI